MKEGERDGVGRALGAVAAVLAATVIAASAAMIAVLAIGASLLTVSATSTSSAEQERPPVAVLGAVETRSSVPAPAPVAEAVVPDTIATTAPLTTAPPTTTVPVPTTTATTVVPPSPPAPTPTERAQQAIAEIGYGWQARFPGWRIDIAGARSGVRALTYPDQNRVELFVRADDTVDGLRRVLAHELGHVADLELNDDADRQRWREARGVGSAVPWWPTGSTYDFDTLAGDFAEGFATWLVGSASESRVGGPLRADHLALMRELAG
ncbi:MAG: hypothetical protein OEW42_07135 [Acidimicrobiia bacterium]|nr:hypothetical protein [Acidimicrobiia bacterium]